MEKKKLDLAKWYTYHIVINRKLIDLLNFFMHQLFVLNTLGTYKIIIKIRDRSALNKFIILPSYRYIELGYVK